MVTTVVTLFLSIHHFYNFHFCIQPQMIEEHLEVFLHLDAVVIHLSHSEDPHLTLPPNLEVDETQIWWQDGKKETSEKMAGGERDTLTLCCRRRKGSSISRPPSWTTHHTSMVPSASRSWFVGKLSTFLATSKAWCAVVVSRTVSAWNRSIDRM